MNNINMNIWGREFSLKIDFDVYPGEKADKAQNDALNGFLSISNKAFETAKESVKNYIISNADAGIDGMSVDNIFKYVLPKAIYIPRNQQRHTVAILCDFRFDVEHGLAIIFCGGKLKEIGPDDIVL